MVIVSGCSYSISCENYSAPYSFQLRDMGFDVCSISHPGQSNSAIIRKIWDWLNENRTYTSGHTFICQLTWLHRFGMWHDVGNRWIDYQPNHMNFTPQWDEINDEVITKFDYESIVALNDTPRNGLTNNYGISDVDFYRLSDWYKLYLELIYNEEKEFQHLLYQIDTIREYVKSRGSDIIFIYWPPVTDKQKWQLEKRGFFNMNGEYSMLKWSTKNKLLGWNDRFEEYDSHLSLKGHQLLAKELFKYIKIS